MEKLKGKLVGILRWSEKYTKTDMVYLASGGFWLSLNQISNSLIAFLITITFAYLLPKEIYGNYKYILSIAAMIAGFSLTGIPSSITQAVARGFEGTLKEGFNLTLRWGLLMSLISFIGSFYYFVQENNSLAISLLIIGLTSPILQASSVYSSYSVGKKDFRTNAIFGLLQNIIPAIFILTTVFFTKNLLIIIFVYFVINTITDYGLYLITLKKYRPNDEIDKSTSKFGKHLSLMNVLGGISFQLDKILVFHYLGAIPLAIYSIAMAPPQQIRTLTKVLPTLMLPKLSIKSGEILKKTVPRKALVMLLSVIPVVIFYVIAAPFLFKIFFPQYLDSVVYSQVFSTIILFLPSMIYQQSLTAHLRTKELYFLQIFGPVIKIISLFILLPMIGIWGALISMFAYEIFRIISVIIFFHKIPD